MANVSLEYDLDGEIGDFAFFGFDLLAIQYFKIGLYTVSIEYIDPLNIPRNRLNGFPHIPQLLPLLQIRNHRKHNMQVHQINPISNSDMIFHSHRMNKLMNFPDVERIEGLIDNFGVSEKVYQVYAQGECELGGVVGLLGG